MLRARFIVWLIAAMILIADLITVGAAAVAYPRQRATLSDQKDESVWDTSFGFPVRIAYSSSLIIGPQYNDLMVFLLIDDRYCSPASFRLLFDRLAQRYRESEFVEIDVYSDPEMLRRAILRYKQYPDDLRFADTPEGEEFEKTIRGDLFIPKTGWARARYFKRPKEGERFFYKTDPQKVDMAEVVMKLAPVPQYVGDLQADLFLACKLDDLPKAQALIDSGAMIDYKNDAGETALVYASEHNKPEIVKLLLTRGAYVNSKNKYGQTALCVALSHRFHEIFRALLEHNADVNARYGPGISTLHLASFKGDADAVEALLSKGADPNATDGDGNTPLFNAVRGRNARIVRALIENGAWLRMKNNRGQTLEGLARETGDQAIIELIGTNRIR